MWKFLIRLWEIWRWLWSPLIIIVGTSIFINYFSFWGSFHMLNLLFFFFILTWGHFFHCFGREEGREKHRCEREASIGCSRTCPTREGTCNLDMCPNQESNLQPFGYGMMFQPTEPQRPGLELLWVFSGISWTTTMNSVLCIAQCRYIHLHYLCVHN